LIALKWLSLFVLAWNFVLVPIVGIWYVLPMLPVAELVKAIIALSLGS
jgi:hypothetical protein